MNRHRAYRSKMGVEPDTEPSALSTRRNRHKKALEKMINQYPNDGFNEIVNLLQEIQDEFKNKKG